MSQPNYCQLWLTCENTVEADTIAQALLDKKLIACAKQLPIEADYWWEGAKEHNSETLLIMESIEELFEKIEQEVTKLHSYDTFVLQAIPMVKISKKAEAWLKETITKS